MIPFRSSRRTGLQLTLILLEDSTVVMTARGGRLGSGKNYYVKKTHNSTRIERGPGVQLTEIRLEHTAAKGGQTLSNMSLRWY